ncbi:hypothetical protein Ancab_005340 [Ancistrocladus abbreviatus]
MASLLSLSFYSLLYLPPPGSCSRNSTFLPKLPFKSPKVTLRLSASSSAPNSLPPSTEKAFLEAVSDSDEKILPCVRSYENDLARLTLVGAVDFEQALTAAAADGGEAAGEHINSGMSTMVVETLFPGPSDENSTVSTRLFLPARKVKEKARKLRSSLTEDLLSSTSSRNILAMTFRQVVMQQLWNFELVLFMPGSERDMQDLESPREQVPATFTVNSSNERVISALAEVLCMFALESTERQFLGGSSRWASKAFYHWFSKTNKIASKDSSVSLYLFEDEIVENAKSLLESFNSVKANHKKVKKNQKGCWLGSLMRSNLEKIGGSDFSSWTSEFVPAYKLQIDADRLAGVKYVGWKKISENWWEVLLTHSQMVRLAEILDVFFEDLYTFPHKQLSCGMEENPKKLMKNKRSSSFWGILSNALASAVFLISISVLYQLSLPKLLLNRREQPGEYHSLSSSVTSSFQPASLEASELEAFCTEIVRKIKDYYCWDGKLEQEQKVGVWIGELPAFLRNSPDADNSGHYMSATSAHESKSEQELKLSALDIASYQVVLSLDGKIVGFQPTSLVAVNHWAANPLAKELYGRKKLSPGMHLFLSQLLLLRSQNTLI